MKVTIKDIARKVQVSKTLVSLYLNDHPLSAKISAKTKARIDEAVRELGYRPSFAARALAKGRTGTIGMIVGAIRDPFSYYLADLAMREVERYHCQLLLMMTNQDRRDRNRCLERLLENRVDGVLCCSELPSDTPLYAELLARRFPLVAVNRKQADFSCIYNDFSPAVDELLACLDSIGAGTLYLISTAGNRIAGLLRSGCAARGIRLTASRNLVTDSDMEAICGTVLRRRPPFLFLTNCRAARVIVNEIHRAGIDYFPAIFTVYTLPADIIDDSRIAGAIQYNFTPLITCGLEMLNRQLEASGTAEREETVLPARFLRQDRFCELETLGRYNFRTS
jgi:transcriptional regulator, lacI family